MKYFYVSAMMSKWWLSKCHLLFLHIHILTWNQGPLKGVDDSTVVDKLEEIFVDSAHDDIIDVLTEGN